MLRMPAEWEPHERTWMAWPCAAYALGDNTQMAAQSPPRVGAGGAGRSHVRTRHRTCRSGR